LLIINYNVQARQSDLIYMLTCIVLIMLVGCREWTDTLRCLDHLEGGGGANRGHWHIHKNSVMDRLRCICRYK
jgi:hypothetical protein